MQTLKRLTAEALNTLNPCYNAERVVESKAVTVLELITEYGISYDDQLWILEQTPLSSERFQVELYKLLARKKQQKLKDASFNNALSICLDELESNDTSTKNKAKKELKYYALRAACGYDQSDGEKYLPEIIALINTALEQDFFYDT